MPTAILAEDEPLLRTELRDQLALLWPELEIVAEADNGVEAIRAIDALQPDFVFLDIQMPALDGLEVARHIGDKTQVVFVTAYAEHALQAFDAGAVDYLLKPLITARLAQTVKKLQQRGAVQLPPEAVWRTAFAAPAPGFLKWIKASQGDTVRLIVVDDVLCFQSDGKYTGVVTRDNEALIRTPLKTLLEQLDPARFAQIHRGCIVNLHAVDRIERNGASIDLYLHGRQRPLSVSETFARQFKQM
jgi:DNA-binding LytR/AlgR family response regulator